ncbi:MAG TPA: hypothetical protein VGC99_03990 [Candidatus Tectomicrobia bacterium]
MAKPKLTYVGDAKVRALLEAYACPVPLHAVRARFMGNIASPVLGASPLRSIESLWPDGLPTFEGTNEANRLLQALMSLWNHLARHQKPTKPFRFANTEKLASPEELSTLVVMRCEEVDNFLEGFFDGEEELEVSEDIADELDTFEEIYRLLSKVRDVLTNGPDPQTETGLPDFPRHVRDLSLMAEAQVNNIIQACIAWRRAAITSQGVKRRTLH